MNRSIVIAVTATVFLVANVGGATAADAFLFELLDSVSGLGLGSGR